MYILKIGKYKDFYYNLSVLYDPFFNGYMDTSYFNVISNK